MTAVPLIEAVSVRFYTKDDTDALDTIAMWQPDTDQIPEDAAGYVWPGFDADMRWCAWTDFVRAVRDREAIGTAGHWFDDDIDGYGTASEAERDRACELADRAREWLITGPGR